MSDFSGSSDDDFSDDFSEDNKNKDSGDDFEFGESYAESDKESPKKKRSNSNSGGGNGKGGKTTKVQNLPFDEAVEDVVEIDILYKQEDSNVIYSIGTIRHIDPEWHAWNLYPEGVGVGFAGHYTENMQPSNSNFLDNMEYTYSEDGGYTKGKYTVTTENIYAALPANQLLRPWDNVPRKALAQEIVGNRKDTFL